MVLRDEWDILAMNVCLQTTNLLVIIRWEFVHILDRFKANGDD